MDRARAAVVAGVQGGQKVDYLRATDFADDDSVGAHSQGLPNKIADGYRADALHVRGARDQSYDVGMWGCQFGGVFDADDAFVGGDLGQ